MIKFLYIVSLALSSIYLIKKGGMPQISDVTFLLCVFVLLVKLIRDRKTGNLSSGIASLVNKYLLLFAFYSLLVNFFWLNFYFDFDFVLASGVIVYNVIFFGVTLYLLRDNMISMKELYKFIMISVVISFIGVLINSGSIGRSTGFFNNPNQLGYFSVISYTTLVFIREKYGVFKNLAVLEFFLCGMQLFASGSRSAVIGILGWIIILFMIKKNHQIIRIVMVGGVFLLLGYLFENIKLENITTGNYSLDFLLQRLTLQEAQADDIIDRGYDRIINDYQYLFFGAGEGRYDRFNSNFFGEIHSTWLNLLFSYGMVGFGLFLVFLSGFFRKKNDFLLWFFPILFYGISHNGLRSALLWMFFAVVYYHYVVQVGENQSNGSKSDPFNRNESLGRYAGE